MWKMTPKWHLFIHLCVYDIRELRLNPRPYWTYADENLVGVLVEVGQTCQEFRRGCWSGVDKWPFTQRLTGTIAAL